MTEVVVHLAERVAVAGDLQLRARLAQIQRGFVEMAQHHVRDATLGQRHAERARRTHAVQRAHGGVERRRCCGPAAVLADRDPAAHAQRPCAQLRQRGGGRVGQHALDDRFGAVELAGVELDARQFVAQFRRLAHRIGRALDGCACGIELVRQQRGAGALLAFLQRRVGGGFVARLAAERGQ